ASPLVRARETMEIVRAELGLEPAGYAIAGQLAEIAFGEWEGLTYAQVMARDKQVIAARESDKWSFAPPGGESYAQVAVRVRNWYETVARDTVVAAHGGTARALIAHLGLAPPQDAAHYSIDQGVVHRRLRPARGHLTAARTRATTRRGWHPMSFNTFGHLFRVTTFGESH